MTKVTSIFNVDILSSKYNKLLMTFSRISNRNNPIYYFTMSTPVQND